MIEHYVNKLNLSSRLTKSIEPSFYIPATSTGSSGNSAFTGQKSTTAVFSLPLSGTSPPPNKALATPTFATSPPHRTAALSHPSRRKTSQTSPRLESPQNPLTPLATAPLRCQATHTSPLPSLASPQPPHLPSLRPPLDPLTSTWAKTEAPASSSRPAVAT